MAIIVPSSLSDSEQPNWSLLELPLIVFPRGAQFVPLFWNTSTIPVSLVNPLPPIEPMARIEPSLLSITELPISWFSLLPKNDPILDHVPPWFS